MQIAQKAAECERRGGVIARERGIGIFTVLREHGFFRRLEVKARLAALHAAGHRPRVQNAQGERAVVEQQFVAVLQISGQDRRDGKGFAERERIALAQRQRREKRADAQLGALQVDEQVTGNALRGLGAAQAFQPRRTLFEGTVGKVQAHAAHPRAQQSAERIRVGAGGAERAVELAGHGVSSLG